MTQLEGRYHAQTKLFQFLRTILSLESRAVTSTPVSMAVIPVQNTCMTIVSLATHTVSLGGGIAEYATQRGCILRGCTKGPSGCTVGSVLLASHPNQPRKYNSTICGLVSFKSFSMEDLSRVHLLQVHCHGNPEALCPC